MTVIGGIIVKYATYHSLESMFYAVINRYTVMPIAMVIDSALYEHAMSVDQARFAAMVPFRVLIAFRGARNVPI